MRWSVVATDCRVGDQSGSVSSCGWAPVREGKDLEGDFVGVR